MAKKAKAVKPGNLELRLPQGFIAIETTLMELDVLKLKKTITPRMESLRKVMGSKADKLAGFCVECLPVGDKALVPVVARTIDQGENGHSYLCLCPCVGSQEAFTISEVFLSNVTLDGNSRMKSVPLVQPKQKNVAYATR